jgi:hypothetical protein
MEQPPRNVDCSLSAPAPSLGVGVFVVGAVVALRMYRPASARSMQSGKSLSKPRLRITDLGRQALAGM